MIILNWVVGASIFLIIFFSTFMLGEKISCQQSLIQQSFIQSTILLHDQKKKVIVTTHCNKKLISKFSKNLTTTIDRNKKVMVIHLNEGL